jgi:hypothetical protein
MAEIPNWHITGDWFDNCSCAVACPCTFAQAPDNGFCEPDSKRGNGIARRAAALTSWRYSTRSAAPSSRNQHAKCDLRPKWRTGLGRMYAGRGLN